MRKQTRSILQELNSFSNKKDVELIVESRALHVINSAINILEMVKENFPEETALDLERRLINSIRGGDPDKFRRGIRKIQESKRGPLWKISLRYQMPFCTSLKEDQAQLNLELRQLQVRKESYEVKYELVKPYDEQ